LAAEIDEVAMTVEEPTRIDIYAFDPKQQRVYVVIADHLGWDEDEEEHHLLCLNEKIKNYLYFLTSGQLEEHKPQWKGFPVTIRVTALCEPKGEGVKFYRIAKELIRDAGFSFEFKLGSLE
jgi:hypothetical protein